jgi:hypothetical protein
MGFIDRGKRCLRGGLFGYIAERPSDDQPERLSGCLNESGTSPAPMGLFLGSDAYYSLLSRFIPSTSGCQPYTSVNMKLSMRKAFGSLPLFKVDL